MTALDDTIGKAENRPEKVSNYFKEVINYMNKFWKEIFVYLNDGNYPIDNNLAKRCICNSQHNVTACSTSAVTRGEDYLSLSPKTIGMALYQ